MEKSPLCGTENDAERKHQLQQQIHREDRNERLKPIQDSSNSRDEKNND